MLKLSHWIRLRTYQAELEGYNTTFLNRRSYLHTYSLTFISILLQMRYGDSDLREFRTAGSLSFPAFLYAPFPYRLSNHAHARNDSIRDDRLTVRQSPSLLTFGHLQRIHQQFYNFIKRVLSICMRFFSQYCSDLKSPAIKLGFAKSPYRNECSGTVAYIFHELYFMTISCSSSFVIPLDEWEGCGYNDYINKNSQKEVIPCRNAILLRKGIISANA